MEHLIERLRRFTDERDWKQFHNSKDLAISVTVEAAELLELFQWRPVAEPSDPDFIANIRSEVADVFIYLLLLCDAIGVDLKEATASKIAQNEARFPRATSRGVAKPEDKTAPR